MERRILFCVMFVFVFACSLFSASYPVLKPLRVNEKITIDGMLNESAWEKADVAKNFVLLGKENNPSPLPTEVRVLYDDAALYIGAVCYVTDVKKIRATGKQRDIDISSDDVFEIFLDPGQSRQNYYHIMINTLNTIYDAYCTRKGGSWDQTWNGNFDTAVSIQDNKWNLEVRIPFSILQLTPDVKQDWGINFGREGGSSRFAVSYWSPAGGFHVPEGFGTLAGIDVDFSKFFLRLEEMSLHSYLTDDRNGNVNMSASLVNETGKHLSLNTRVLFFQEGSKKGEIVKQIQIEKDGVKNINLLGAGITPGQYDVNIFVDYQKTNQNLFSLWKKVEISDVPFSARMTKPCYRQTIYDTEKKKEVEIFLQFFGDSKIASALEFYGRILDSKGVEIKKATATIDAKNLSILNFDANELPVGKYTVEISLKDKSGNSFGNIVKKFQRVAPSPLEVRIDEKHRLLVAGKPFLSQQIFGMFNGAKGEFGWKECYEGGFNTGGYASVSQLEDAVKYKCMLTPHVNLKSKDKPGILAWYWHEEADIHTDTIPEKIVKEYKSLCEEDPYHPVEMLLYNSGMFKGVFGEMCDIYTIEPYLYPCYTDTPEKLQNRMNRFIGWLNAIMEAVRMQSVKLESQKAGLAVMQGWDGRAWDQRYHREPSPSRIPSFVEERAMTWLALIHGFTSIGYYNFIIDYWTMEMNPLFWEGLRAVNQEIRMLSDVLLEGEDITERIAQPGSGVKGSVHYQIREYNGDIYVFAVNTTAQNLRFEIPLPTEASKKKFFVISENRTLSTKKGMLSDSFGPFGVHLYTTAGPLSCSTTAGMLKDKIFLKAPQRIHQKGNLASQFSGAKVSSSFKHWNVDHSMFATDDDPFTCWVPSSFFKEGLKIRKPSDWLQVEFPKTEKIKKVIIRSYKPKYQPDPDRVLSDYTIEYWNGKEWVSLASVKGNKKEIITHTFKPVETQKVRIVVTGGLYVGEFEVY